MSQPLQTFVQCMLSVFVGGFGAGFLAGLAPLGTGFVKRRIWAGASGMVWCLASGLTLGALLAVPVAVLTTIWVLRNRRFHGWRVMLAAVLIPTIGGLLTPDA